MIQCSTYILLLLHKSCFVHIHDHTYLSIDQPAFLLCTDQLTLSNIGLPDVQLCYEVNLPSLKKVTSLPEPKHFAVHYKLCGSMDRRISNLSVNDTCKDLHGWLGGHCYEVQLFITLDIDGLEISLNTTAVREG